jgi:hypothetical protein
MHPNTQHKFFKLVPPVSHEPTTVCNMHTTGTNVTTRKLILPFPHLLRLGDMSADLDLDPEGDLDTLPGDDLQ